MQHRLFLCFAVCFLFFSLVAAESITEVFFVRPNQPNKSGAEAKLKSGVSCKFEALSTGGAGEEWTVVLKEENGKVFCKIGRPNTPSYLFFRSFSATLNRPVTQAEVFDNSGALLRGDAYVFNGNTVQNVEGWKGVVNSITLSAEK
eukprot:TRINITY_DN997_c0_g3_i3.p1 TRINITY_DN997_c0_g3~~TRINITY_DN997_c0_g3_i3.p1  ORF type:complete len:162 (+),score=44.38 TRINITY_DN997_c0_g3_i3:49-486(+)